MVLLQFTLDAGRFHGTPWRNQVNEGVTEWPPSPWRILRALAAAAYASVGGPPDGTAALLERLCERLPAYSVPESRQTHTRHYMPKGDDKKTKIFDAYRLTERGAHIYVGWELELSSAQRELLMVLAQGIGYLGRAESWAHCEVIDALPQDVKLNTRPLGPEDWDQHATELLCPVSPRRFQQQLAGLGRLTGRVKQRLPTRLSDALCVHTGQLREDKWDSSRPLGASWVGYALREDACAWRPPSNHHPRSVNVLLFSVSGRPAPRLRYTLQFADDIRRAWLYNLGGKGIVPAVSGHTLDNQPRPDDGAASLLPLDTDGDGFIDHLLIRCTDGLPPRVVRALTRLTTVDGLCSSTTGVGPSAKGAPYTASRRSASGAAYGWEDRSPHKPVHLSLLGAWEEDSFRELGAGRPSFCGPARIWRSATPFLLPRYPKLHKDGRKKLDAAGEWRDGPLQQLRLELGRRGHPLPKRVLEIGGVGPVDRVVPIRHILTRRRKTWAGDRSKKGHTSGIATAFEIEFDKPVDGPIAVGAFRRFGMGVFLPVAD